MEKYDSNSDILYHINIKLDQNFRLFRYIINLNLNENEILFFGGGSGDGIIVRFLIK